MLYVGREAPPTGLEGVAQHLGRCHEAVGGSRLRHFVHPIHGMLAIF